MAYRRTAPTRNGAVHTLAKALRASACVALGCLSFAGCHESEGGGRGGDIELHFDVKIDGQRVACGQPLANVGTNARPVSLNELSFFVHDVQLIDAQGRKVALEMPDDGAWQYKNVALLDFADNTGSCDGSPETNALVRGKVPAGEYTGISFKVGVPAEISHAALGKNRAPLQSSSLYWGWLRGFIFARLELNMEPTATEAAQEYQFHLGANVCTNEAGQYSCARKNIPQVELTGFNAQRDKLVLDVAALLRDVLVGEQPGVKESVPGCASGQTDPDCGPIFSALGLDLASGELAASTQTVFRVQKREDDDLGRTELDAGVVPIDNPDAGGGTPFVLRLPEHSNFSQPNIPADNPLTVEKVELGRHLFYDKRLSENGTQSCASCHKQELAFTDGRAVGLGSTGQSHRRGAMSLANVAYASTMTWAMPSMKSLEEQAHVPIFGLNPVELGFNGLDNELLKRLREAERYPQLFAAAFPGTSDPFTVVNVLRAIASFERTLISGNSPYDRYEAGDLDAISESAKRGAEEFFNPDPGGSAFECFHCHGGPTFSDQLDHSQQLSNEVPFHNNGLYNLDFEGSYPEGNQGVYEETSRSQDKGKFKAPTLRNIAVTAPYMHDGSLATLEDVITHYANGGSTVPMGPYQLRGQSNRNKSTFVHGFSAATAQQRADLLEFLKSLTDEEFLTNPDYADPWQ